MHVTLRESDWSYTEGVNDPVTTDRSEAPDELSPEELEELKALGEMIDQRYDEAVDGRVELIDLKEARRILFERYPPGA